MKRFFKRIGLFFFWLVIFLVLAEGVLRLTGRRTTHSEEKTGKYLYLYDASHYHSWLHLRNPGPGDAAYQSVNFNYPMQLNKERLRDVDHPVEKQDGEFRVLGLGDSFTEGIGAPSDSTWLSLLAHQINQPKDSIKITPINAGVGGSDPFFEYQLLKQRLLKYQPDVVVLAINKTDVTDFFVRGGMERFTTDGKVKFKDPPWQEWWYVRSHVVRLIMHQGGYNWQLISKADQKKLFVNFEEQFKSLVQLYVQLAEANGFKLLLAFHPLDGEVELGNYKYDFAEIITWLEDEGVATIDLMQTMRDKGELGEEAIQKYYWPVDRHFNSKGYQLFANAISAKIDSLGWLPAQSSVSNNSLVR